MTTAIELLRLIAHKIALIAHKIAEKLGVSSYRPFQTQLDRLKDFTECPICHHKETCARLACEGVIDVPEGQIVSFCQEIIFLKQPQLAVVSVPALVAHYDICAKCGMRYSVRVERRDLPVQHKPAPGMPFPVKGKG